MSASVYPAVIVRKGRCAEDGYTEPYAEIETPDGVKTMPMGWNRSGPIFEVGTRGTARYVSTPGAGLWHFTPSEEEDAEFHLSDVEEGSARVNVGRRSVGRVWREKWGSTRTGTRWVARSSWRGVLGYADTRAAAAKLVADEYISHNRRKR